MTTLTPSQLRGKVYSFLDRRISLPEELKGKVKQDDYGILKNMKNEQFEKWLPGFCEILEKYGFNTIIDDMINKLKSDSTDWDKLIHWNDDGKREFTIPAQTQTGMSIMNRYMLKHIYDVKNYRGKSIRSSWNKENLMKAIRNNRRTHSTPYVSEIIRQLGFSNGLTKVTMYRPTLTKLIMQRYKPQRVLDICVGWGGRMLGSVCNPNIHYTGIEPCNKTYEGLVKMKESLKVTNATLYHNTAQAILPTLDDNSFDLALTSPPYYNLEIYTDETTQSFHKEQTYEEWVSTFLKPVVEQTISKLKDDGKSCWSVKNFKTDKQYNLLDDVIKIHLDCGWKLLEDEGFAVTNSTNPMHNTKSKNQEITYVFVKMTPEEMEEMKKKQKETVIENKKDTNHTSDIPNEVSDAMLEYKLNYTLDKVPKNLDMKDSIIYSLIKEHANDVNSSSFREEIAIYVCNHINLAGKLGYDAQTKEGRNVEHKPKNSVGKKNKLSGTGNFTDFTHARIDKYSKDEVLMCVSGFINGKICYAISFPFNHQSFKDHLKTQVTKSLPNGDEPRKYCRSASFGFKHYADCKELKINFITEDFKNKSYETSFNEYMTKPFYDWMKSKV